MRVVHLASGLAGGAGQAARKIHDAVRASGIESRLFVADPRGCDPAVQVLPLPRPPALASRWRELRYRVALKAYGTGRPSRSSLFSYTALPVRTPLPMDGDAPDVVNLHWIAQGFDYASLLESIPNAMPIVWTLHDEEPLTGGCHYTLGCTRFRSRCGSCPQLNALRNPLDLSAGSLRRKARLLARRPVHVVGVSRWIAEQARASAVFAHASAVSVIPNAIDIDRLAPVDRTLARRRFGIPESAFVVGFGATELTAPLKGLDTLLAAVAQLDRSHPVLLVLFGGPLPAQLVPAGVRHLHVGYLGDPASLAAVYSAVDVIALPSIAESFGQVGAEALACGTPVLGSRVGGIPDFVVDGITGRLSEPGSAADFAEKLAWLFDHPNERRAFGAAGRALVREQFSAGQVGARYAALYRSLATQK